ncbi:glycoside hydrolase family 5 protein [Streptacidiphilus sp. PAMC 29251]
MPRQLPAPSLPRSILAAAVAALLMLGVCVVGAHVDRTGLFALLPASELRVGPVHGLWSLAGVAVFLPVLAVVVFGGTVSSLRGAVAGLGRGRVLLRVWGLCVLAAGTARLLQVLAELAGAAVQGGTRMAAMSVATALWTSGLTAERAVLLGWLPALGAALVHRRASGPKLTGLGWRWSLAATGLSLALLGPLVGPMLWEGSPAASLYGEHLSLRSLPLGPARFAVELVVATTVGTLLLSRSSRRFDCGRASRLLLAGWLAALGGGAAAGVVQTLLALPRDLAGPDRFVLADAGLRIGTGLSLGLAFGWAVLPTLMLISRALGAIAGERRRFLSVAASALVLALGSWLLSAAAPSSAATTGPTPPVSAAARATAGQPLPALIVRDGRIEEVNGRQVQLRGADTGTDTAAPTGAATAAAIAGIAAHGFNVVRLKVSWPLLEPRPGHWDQAYLKQVKDAVATAAAHGLYTAIDLQQSAWNRNTSDSAAFTGFYHDTDGVQSELLRTWALLGRTFAGNPAVAGYGLLDQPGLGEDPPVTSSVLLGAYYHRAVQTIRTQEAAVPGGFPHLVLIEPSVQWSRLGFDAAPPQGFSDDPYLVFAPHLRTGPTRAERDLGITLVSAQRGAELAQQQADAYGMPLWTNAWSAPGTALPQAPYPLFAPGGPTRTAVDAQGRLTLSGSAPKGVTGAGCTLDVWFPGTARPAVGGSGVVGVDLRKVDGGWRITGCAGGNYRLTAGAS